MSAPKHTPASGWASAYLSSAHSEVAHALALVGGAKNGVIGAALQQALDAIEAADVALEQGR